MKKILITGENSYIGTKFEEWLLKNSKDYLVDTISVRGDTWKSQDFSKYDVIYHVAGIAHRKEIKKNAELYYKVNRDLTYEVAKKAKYEGVRHFIFLSSMSVYGIEQGIITKKTFPKPTTNYGISKLEAEKLIREIESDDFKVAIIRPPMVYGPGCKGNYDRLIKLVKIIPLFPSIKNERSMIYINNLSEFIRLLINRKESGIFYPQNIEFVDTRSMVESISKLYNKKIYFTAFFNPIIKIFLCLRISVIKKMFGNLTYDKSLSSNIKEYNIYEFQETITIE